MTVVAALLGIPPLPLSTDALTTTSRHPSAQIMASVCIVCFFVIVRGKRTVFTWTEKKNSNALKGLRPDDRPGQVILMSGVVFSNVHYNISFGTLVSISRDWSAGARPTDCCSVLSETHRNA